LPTRTHRYEPRDARANGARYLAIDTSHLVAWYEAVAGEVPSDLAECLSVNTESLGVPGMPHVRPN
jgi:hypothetical protein